MLEVGWWGSLRDLSINILKQGVGKGESCSQGEGVSKVSPPLPSPTENFNHTFTIIIPSRCNSHATTGNWTINDSWGAGIKAVQTDSTKTNTHVLDA